MDYKLKRWRSILVAVVLVTPGAGWSAAQAAPAAPANKPTQVTHIELPPVPKPLLPAEFDGWAQTAAPEKFSNAGQADPGSAAALREYGFSYGEQVNFKRDANETLTMRALNFGDESGAYGAYSYYRQNGWPKEDIGTGGTADKNRVLFWKGTTVVDARFSQIGPMSAGEMREVAARLPTPYGNRALPPPILAYLPQGSLDHQTTHYAEGPEGYTGSGGVLPASVVDFNRGAEAVTADYSLPSGAATLTIIDYPTPQIAQSQEAAIRAYIQAGGKAQPPWPQPLTNSDQASIEVRRSGVLVAVVSGDAIPDESHRLLERVHYDANLISIPQSGESEIAKTGELLVGIATIVVVGSIAAILLGFFLGGGRALYRVAHGKPASSVYDEEFIHLDLRPDRIEPRPPEGESASDRLTARKSVEKRT
jgi:hypothetical protein